MQLLQRGVTTGTEAGSIYQIKDTSDRTAYTVELELKMFYTLFDQPTHTMAGNL
jgi:hypothetical protein